MSDLSPLEREVIATILAPEHPIMNALRQQFDHCHVASRDATGVGFFTALAIDSAVAPAPVRAGTMDLGDVCASIDGLERGAGFVLFVRDGILDVLEGFSYDEPWLDLSAGYLVSAGRVVHSGGSASDIEQADAAWDRTAGLHER